MKKLILLFSALALVACDSGGDGGGINNLLDGNPGEKAAVSNNGQPIDGMVNVSGSWKGTAVMTEDGQSKNCESLVLNFSQSASQFSVKNGTLVCGGDTGKLDPATFTIEAGELKQNGVQVGTVNAEGLVVKGEGESYTIWRQGEKLMFVVDYLTEQGGVGKISSELSRQ